MNNMQDDGPRRTQPDAQLRPPSDGAGKILADGMIESYDLLPGSVIVADARGTIQYVNPHALKRLGFHAGEMTGLPLSDFWDQSREASREVLDHLDQHRFWQGKIKQRTKNGTGHWQTVSLSIVPCTRSDETILVQIGLPVPTDDMPKYQELENRCRELEEETNRYQTILNASPDPICLTRVEDGKYVYVNETFFERTGFTPEQIAKHSSIELNVYTDPDERTRLLNRVKRTGRVENMEVTMRRKDGRIVSDLWSLRIVDYEGEPHLLLISRNYSQLRAAQQALMESEASYRLILNSAPYSISVTRISDACYVEVNDAFCRRTGFSREEAIGHSPYELGIVVDSGFRDAIYERLGNSGRVEGLEVQFRSRDGVILENLLSATPITYKGENCLLTLAVSIDELKAAQRALKESEERYRNILKNMEEGYWETDLKGTYTFVNEAECRIHKRPREELVGTRSKEISSQDSYAKVSPLFNQVYKTGKPLPLYEVDIIQGDGAIVTIESSASLLRDAKGMSVGFFGISRDISEKRKAEKELEQYRLHLEKMVQERTKALEEAQDELVKREKLAVLGQLTATVSHELRNPLGVIRFSNFYLQRNVDKRSEKIVKHFSRIEEQVAHCDRIVADLLEYTRGKPITVETLPLHTWLKELVNQIQETQSIAISHQIPDDLPPIAHDREKMRRVFINLIENAIQAIKDRQGSSNGLTTDYVPNISITLHREPEQLAVVITDNGVGMDQHTRNKAFEPLFTTRARGTGIGLANVQRIVNDHGGIVTLVSESGVGTTATVNLPYSRALKQS